MLWSFLDAAFLLKTGNPKYLSTEELAEFSTGAWPQLDLFIRIVLLFLDMDMTIYNPKVIFIQRWK